MIPQFDMSGVLPPFIGGSPTAEASMSPYQTSMTEVVSRFSHSAERRVILLGLLNYQLDLMNAGIQSGFQWLDGSFVENIEVIENRTPNDIDVVTFFHRPVEQPEEWREWFEINGHLFKKSHTKNTYKCDAFGVDFALPPEHIVRRTRYWFGLFSHRRQSGLWKGMVEVPLDFADNSKARDRLEDITP